MSNFILQPFKKTRMPESEIQRAIDGTMDRWRAGDVEIRAAIPASTETAARALMQKMYDQDSEDYEVWINDLYQVAVYDRKKPNCHVIHLSIKRRDRAPIRDWRHMQDIKNQLVGPNHEAVELYPAENRRVDAANQYHLWVAKSEEFKFPFGFNTRCVKDADTKLPGTEQRQL